MSEGCVRYIGNKTKLVPFLLETLGELGLPPGVACDPFAGTASVGRALKMAGWRVHCGDLMAASYAYQVARVELDRTPRYSGALAGGRGRADTVSYSAVLRVLEALPPTPGFVTEHYTPAGEDGREHGRMYFTPENGAAIDAVRGQITDWRAEGLIDRPGEQLLLATLIQAADRVANTTGVYASFVKTWQPNATFGRSSSAHEAHRAAGHLGPGLLRVPRAGGDLAAPSRDAWTSCTSILHTTNDSIRATTTCRSSWRRVGIRRLSCEGRRG